VVATAKQALAAGTSHSVGGFGAMADSLYVGPDGFVGVSINWWTV